MTDQSGFSSPAVGGGNEIIREEIKSPDYVPGVSGWSIMKNGSAEFNDVVVRGVLEGTSYVINADGAFFYHGTPQANNLIVSIATADGTDAFGNGFIPGVVTYDTRGDTDPGGYIQMLAQSVVIGSITAGVFQSNQDAGNFSGNSSEMNIVSSIDPGNPVGTAAQIWAILTSGTAAAVTGSATAPFFSIADTTDASTVDMGLSGTLIKTASDRTQEVWHEPGTTGNPAYASTNFAAGSIASANYQHLHYHKDALDNLIVEGTFHATVALVAGAYTIFSLPSVGGFRPKKIHPCAGLHVSSADAFKAAIRVNVDLSGAVNFSTTSAIAISDGFYFSVTVPLGNIT